MAEGELTPTATSGFSYFCPHCGDLWARIEPVEGSDFWTLVRHPCHAHPERVSASSGDPSSAPFRVPGSIYHSPLHLPTAGRLLLESPAWAQHEAYVHSRLSHPA